MIKSYDQLTMKEKCQIFLRADDEDTRHSYWEDIVEEAGPIILDSWLKSKFNENKVTKAESEWGGIMEEWCIFASDSEKSELLGMLKLDD